MDTDREFEHMMMSVRNSSGSITQMVYAANMLQIKLVQFVARLAYKGYLSVKSRGVRKAVRRKIHDIQHTGFHRACK